MSGLIIVDPRSEDARIVTGDEEGLGVFHDIENDLLYFSDGESIYKWGTASGSPQTYTWKSGIIRLPQLVNLGAAIVEAESYAALTFKLYADGVLKHTEAVSDGEPFRLPGGYLSNIYEVELTGTDTVTRVSVAENVWELAEG